MTGTIGIVDVLPPHPTPIIVNLQVLTPAQPMSCGSGDGKIADFAAD